ncbi:6-bladed beta-propeller [Jiulongibacter sediminis]|uniref:6-bladed beta-propeller n=1 Tax=Jiulongibacter sediminis TaxID=1605367 RepID=UPI0026F09E6A|nr:6-bladed beta-propeller [Jiulongibacter sediminis]
MYLNRRNALKLGGASLLAASLPGLTFGNNDEIIIGHNSHQYRVNTNWGMLEAGKNPVNNCHELVEDSQGRIILLTDETKNNVLIYSKKGKLLESWGTSYPGAHGLTIGGQGKDQFLLIADNSRHQVIKTDLRGNVIFKIEYPKETGEYLHPGQFVPTETAIDPVNGDIYVVDGYGLNFVMVYDQNGKFLRYFGGKGEENEHFRCNHGILFDQRKGKEDEILITSRQDNCWKKFNRQGTYLGAIEMPGSFICRPVQQGDNLYGAVYRSGSEANEFSGFIQVVDKDDKVISSPGGSEPVYSNGKLEEQAKDDPANVFMHPHDVYVDSDENIYVAQWASKKTYPIKLERV